MINLRGYVFADLEGTTLTSEDKELLENPDIAGVILFARNYESLSQLKELTKSIHTLRSDLVVGVDQEGGRVQRFREGFTEIPPMETFGQQYDEDADSARAALKETMNVLLRELKESGVDLSFIPVVDVNHGVSDIIGGRSFHQNAKVISDLAGVVISMCHAYGMPATIKHFPGHGAVSADSHDTLPVDNRTWEEISGRDLQPFASLAKKADAVMPAHIVYPQLDVNPACFSNFWLQDVLRDQLGFEGVIISDDLSMNGAAGMGDYDERAAKALAAGCDLLLVCNNRDGLVKVLENCGMERALHSQPRLDTYIRKMRSSAVV